MGPLNEYVWMRRDEGVGKGPKGMTLKNEFNLNLNEEGPESIAPTNVIL